MQTRQHAADSPLFRAVSVILVSAYLIVVGAWLMLTRQIPSPGFFRIIRALWRKPYSGVIDQFTPEQGHCYLAALPGELLSDRDSTSSLQVFEDGRALGPGRAAHDDVRRRGTGCFSHWGEQLYFSTSDNSDPRTNGRRYSVKEVRT